MRTRRTTFFIEPPVASVAAASANATPFSVTMRRASTLAARPPRASFRSHKAMTSCVSRPSRAASRANVIQFQIMSCRIRELGGANARPNAEALGKKPIKKKPREEGGRGLSILGKTTNDADSVARARRIVGALSGDSKAGEKEKPRPRWIGRGSQPKG